MRGIRQVWMRALATLLSVAMAAAPAVADEWNRAEPDLQPKAFGLKAAIRDKAAEAGAKDTAGDLGVARLNWQKPTHEQASALIGNGSTNGLSIRVNPANPNQISFRGDVSALTDEAKTKILDSAVGEDAKGGAITLRQQGNADIAAGRNTPAAKLVTALTNAKPGTTVDVVYTAGKGGQAGKAQVMYSGAYAGNAGGRATANDRQVALSVQVGSWAPASDQQAAGLIGDGSANGISIRVNPANGNETSFRGNVAALTEDAKTKVLDAQVGTNAQGGAITLRQQGEADIKAGRDTPAGRLVAALTNENAGTTVSFVYTASPAGGAGKVETLGSGANAWETRSLPSGRTGTFAVAPKGAPGGAPAGKLPNPNIGFVNAFGPRAAGGDNAVAQGEAARPNTKAPNTSGWKAATGKQASTLIGAGSPDGLSIRVNPANGNQTSFRGAATALTAEAKEKVLDAQVGTNAKGGAITLRQQGEADIKAGRDTPAGRLVTALTNTQPGTDVSFALTEAPTAGGKAKVDIIGTGANATEVRLMANGREGRFAVPPPGAPRVAAAPVVAAAGGGAAPRVAAVPAARRAGAAGAPRPGAAGQPAGVAAVADVHQAAGFLVETGKNAVEIPAEAAGPNAVKLQVSAKGLSADGKKAVNDAIAVVAKVNPIGAGALTAAVAKGADLNVTVALGAGGPKVVGVEVVNGAGGRNAVTKKVADELTNKGGAVVQKLPNGNFTVTVKAGDLNLPAKAQLKALAGGGNKEAANILAAKPGDLVTVVVNPNARIGAAIVAGPVGANPVAANPAGAEKAGRAVIGQQIFAGGAAPARAVNAVGGNPGVFKVNVNNAQITPAFRQQLAAMLPAAQVKMLKAGANIQLTVAVNGNQVAIQRAVVPQANGAHLVLMNDGGGRLAAAGAPVRVPLAGGRVVPGAMPRLAGNVPPRAVQFLTKIGDVLFQRADIKDVAKGAPMVAFLNKQNVGAQFKQLLGVAEGELRPRDLAKNSNYGKAVAILQRNGFDRVTGTFAPGLNTNARSIEQAWNLLNNMRT